MRMDSSTERELGVGRGRQSQKRGQADRTHDVLKVVVVVDADCKKETTISAYAPASYSGTEERLRWRDSSWRVSQPK